MDTSFSSVRYVQDYCERIAESRRDGYYFVPILGAGLSVPSGVPQAAALTRYIAWCFLRVLGLDPWADVNRKEGVFPTCPGQRPWTPRIGLWLDLATDMRGHSCNPGPETFRSSLSTLQMDSVLKYTIDLLEGGRRFEHVPGANRSPAFSAELVREVYGALADWRTALQLLSRIDHEKGAVTNGGRTSAVGTWSVVLRAPDRSVIDSFFKFHTSGKEPAQTHRMIAALAPVLRMHVLLTPNFDDLVERAFTAIGSPLKVFEIPNEVPLPDPRLVSQQRSLIKLHGGSFGLRADYSIDETPDIRDSARFLGYLAGRPLRVEELKDADTKYPDRVAVMLCGISGKDQRVLALLRLARARFSNLKIFWFCHSSRDVDSVRAHFCGNGWNVVADDASIKETIEPNLFVVRHIDYGALLHQVYQRCTNSIPSAGVTFPAPWNLYSAPRIPEPDSAQFPKFQLVLATILSAVQKELDKRGGRRPILIPLRNGVRGGAALLSCLYWSGLRLAAQRRAEETPLNPVWIDLEDVATPAGLFLRLALALAQRGGAPNPISAIPLADFYVRNGQRFQEVLLRACQEHHARTGECQLVCLNAQEPLGICSPFATDHQQVTTPAYSQSPDPVRSQGWFQEGRVDENISLVIDTICKLNADPANGIQFVMAMRQPETTEGSERGMRAAYDQIAIRYKSKFHRVGGEGDENSEVTSPLSDFNPAAVASTVEIWAQSNAAQSSLKVAFLRLLFGFRFSPFEAGLIRLMRRLIDDASSERWDISDPSSLVRMWLDDLEVMQAIRWKVGGAIWIDGALRTRVLALPLVKDMDHNMVLLVEALQARWYGRLLLATGDPLPATESAIHAFRGVGDWLRTLTSSSSDSSLGCEASLNRAVLMILHARGVLDTSRALLEERLSDQFADHTLLLTHASLQVTLIAYQEVMSRFPSLATRPAFTKLNEALDSAQREIAKLRIGLYLQEGEFEVLVNHFDSKMGGAEASLDAFQKLDFATARMCLRDYKGAEEEFHQVWQELTGRSPSEIGNATCSGSAMARKWVASTNANGHFRESAITAAKLCRRIVYLKLLEGLANWLNPRVSESGMRGNERLRLLHVARWIGDFGMEALRCVPVTGDRCVFDENVRLRAHMALVEAILAWHQREPSAQASGFDSALAWLTDGEAFIEEFPVQDGKVGRIIMELRRAEILLIQTGGGGWLNEVRKVFESVCVGPSGTIQKSNIEDVRKIIESSFPENAKHQGDLHQRIAVVYEALRCLERCECELRKHPKNRWWWWIYLVLRVHAAEALFTLRLMLPGVRSGLQRTYIIQPSVITFVSTEFETWIRKIGLIDPFQLARIFRSFRRLFAAEQLYRTALGQDRNDLENKIQDNLAKVASCLADALVARKASGIDTKAPLDPLVKSFCYRCLSQAQAMRIWTPQEGIELELRCET